MDQRDGAARGKRRQCLATVLVNLVSFSVGNVMGWTSPMIPLLMSSTPPIGTEAMSQETISWIGSVFFIGSIIGTFFWWAVIENIGRKPTCLLSAIPCVICWSMTLAAQNSNWLILSRLIIGLSFSGIYLSSPIYIAEIAEDNIRGSLVLCLGLFYNAGLVFSYTVGAFTSYNILSALCLAVPIIFLLAFCWFPESPIFLASKGKLAEAENALEWFRGGDTTQMTKEIAKIQKKPKKTIKVSLKSLVRSRGLILALFLSLILNLGQILSASMVIITYAVKILQTSNTPLSPQISTIIVGVLQFCSVLVSSLLVDRAGRKVLLVISYMSMAISLTVLGGYLYLETNTELSPLMGWIPIVTLCVHVVVYNIGSGPIGIVVISEILPQDIKGYAMAKLQMVKAFTAFASVKFYPLLTYYLNNYGSFWFFAFWCLLFGIIILVYLPETKCKSFQEIQKKFDIRESLPEYENECENILVKKNKTFDSCTQNGEKT